MRNFEYSQYLLMRRFVVCATKRLASDEVPCPEFELTHATAIDKQSQSEPSPSGLS